jgi:hypothetical protein
MERLSPNLLNPIPNQSWVGLGCVGGQSAVTRPTRTPQNDHLGYPRSVVLGSMISCGVGKSSFSGEERSPASPRAGSGCEPVCKSLYRSTSISLLYFIGRTFDLKLFPLVILDPIIVPGSVPNELRTNCFRGNYAGVLEDDTQGADWRLKMQVQNPRKPVLEHPISRIRVHECIPGLLRVEAEVRREADCLA